MKHHIEILRCLQNNRSVSSRDLAKQLGISVSAVDECVRALRDWEFGISDLPGTGYQLTESLQLVDENRLREELRSKGLLIEDRLEVLGEVDSTSERLLECPDRDSLHGRTCVAEFQSQVGVDGGVPGWVCPAETSCCPWLGKWIEQQSVSGA